MPGFSKIIVATLLGSWFEWISMVYSPWESVICEPLGTSRMLTMTP
jgi:hypothetical protein